MGAVLAPWLDVELGQAGLHLGPGPVGLVHINSTKEKKEEKEVNYHKHQPSFVGLTK